MAPRWTGMWAAWASKRPSPKNKAQLKSSRLFDVGAVGGAFQRHAHFFGYGGKQMAKDGESGGGWCHK